MPVEDREYPKPNQSTETEMPGIVMIQEIRDRLQLDMIEWVQRPDWLQPHKKLLMLSIER